MPTPDLAKFYAVLRSGDGPAAEALWRDLDPFLRRAIRLGLIDGRLRRTLDTNDILQSLVKDFLSQDVDASPVAGDAGGLYAYLAAAVRKKIGGKLRKERRHRGSLPSVWEPASTEPAVTQHIEAQDLSQALRARLSESNRRLYDLKAQELSWPEIAEKVGGHPDALRMRLRRAIAAALGEMGQKD
jgi:DNA-directed RNA polymerase specialized sigma24 family protein